MVEEEGRRRSVGAEDEEDYDDDEDDEHSNSKLIETPIGELLKGKNSHIKYPN